MCDQWDVVVTNLTHIDRLKGEHHHHGNGYYNPQNQHTKNRAGVHEVFGSGRTLTQLATGTSTSANTSSQRARFHYTWLSPFHRVCFPDPIRDDIFGYCRPCGGFGTGSLFGYGQSSLEMVGRGEGRVVGAAEIV
jgi:hypothetical protein